MNGMRVSRKSLLVASLLAAVTIIVYAPVAGFDFVSFDDALYVYQNPVVLAGFNWSGWEYAWTTLDHANWHPLTWLSLELDSSLLGTRPAGYHLTNLFLHVLNGLFLFGLLSQWSSSLSRGGIVAGLFLLHPLHVESVAWISERKDVLSTLFLLLTICAYFHYVRRPSIPRYLLMLAMLACGLLAKSMLVTLPILLLLLDYWPLQRIARHRESPKGPQPPGRTLGFLLVEKIPLLVLACADGLITIEAQRIARQNLTGLELWSRLANAFNAGGWYLRKTFLPTNLAIFYPHPEDQLAAGDIAVGVVLFLVISLYAWRVRLHRPYCLVGWAWFVISMLPVIGLMQVGGQAYADRYTYVPHLGLFVAVVWETHYWLEKVPVGRVIWPAAALASVAACGLLTQIQVGYWKNSTTLWTHAIDVVPNNWVAHLHLADVMEAEGKHKQVVEHVTLAMQSKRGANHTDGLCLKGRSLLALGQPAAAEQQFLAAIKLDPNHERSLEELANSLRRQGRNQEADRYTVRRNQLLPKLASQRRKDGRIQLSYGLLLARQGKLAESIRYFERAIEATPFSAAAHNNLAVALSELKRVPEAKAQFQRAIELNPQLATAHLNLGVILRNERDYVSARHHLREALRLNPNDQEAARLLSRLTDSNLDK